MNYVLTFFSTSLFWPNINSLASASSVESPPREVLKCSNTSSNGIFTWWKSIWKVYSLVQIKFEIAITCIFLEWMPVGIEYLPNQCLHDWNSQDQAMVYPSHHPCYSCRLICDQVHVARIKYTSQDEIADEYESIRTKLMQWDWHLKLCILCKVVINWVF